MTQQNLVNGSMEDVLMKTVKLDSRTLTLAGALTLVPKDPPMQIYDNGGAVRTITLPAEADSVGKVFFFANRTGGAFAITIQDDTPATVITLDQLQAGIVFCDGTNWEGFIGSIT